MPDVDMRTLSESVARKLLETISAATGDHLAPDGLRSLAEAYATVEGARPLAPGEDDPEPPRTPNATISRPSRLRGSAYGRPPEGDRAPCRRMRRPSRRRDGGARRVPARRLAVVAQ